MTPQVAGEPVVHIHVIWRGSPFRHASCELFHLDPRGGRHSTNGQLGLAHILRAAIVAQMQLIEILPPPRPRAPVVAAVSEQGFSICHARPERSRLAGDLWDVAVSMTYNIMLRLHFVDPDKFAAKPVLQIGADRGEFFRTAEAARKIW